MAKQSQIEHTHALLVFRRLWHLLLPFLIPAFCILHAATDPNLSQILAHGDGYGDAASAAIVAANKQRRQEVEEEIADYALRRLRQEGREVKTGMAYDVKLPSWTEPLRGAVKGCQVLKAKAGSLRRRGLLFNGFDLPQGIFPTLQSSESTAQTAPAADGVLMTELLLVYRRIHGDLNFTFYTLPAGYTFVSSVVGIATYTYPSNSSFSFSNGGNQKALNTSALTEVQLMVSSGQQQSAPSIAITITVPDLAAAEAENQINGSDIHILAEPLCASFFPNGSFSFSSLAQPPNVCSSSILTDTALVLAPAAANSTNTRHSDPSPDNSEAPIADNVRLPPEASPGASAQHHGHHHIIVLLLLSLGGGIIGLLILIVALIVSVVCCCCPIRSSNKKHPLSSESDLHDSQNQKTSPAASHCPKLLLLHCFDAMAASHKEQSDEDGEFETTRWVGRTRVPTVPALRTKPSIEVGSLQFPCKQ